MNILLVCDQKIPALLYGGTQRIVWWLGDELHKRGHKVSFLAGKGSYSDLADIYIYNANIPLNNQIPDHIDVVHLNFTIEEELTKPFIATLHGNSPADKVYHNNTVFISKNHAKRHNSEVFVYNGLDFNEHGSVDWNFKREHLLFLGKASRSKKNLKGCIKIARSLNKDLAVIGGRDLPLRKGKNTRDLLVEKRKVKSLTNLRLYSFL